MKMFAFCREPSSNFRQMVPWLRKLLLAAILIALLQSNASAGDKPPPGRYIEVEIERDTGKGPAPPLLDEATLKKFREWRYKPEKVRRLKIPMMFQPIPPAVPSGPVLI
jgi:outer membrane biosynthesis protein TonB